MRRIDPSQREGTARLKLSFATTVLGHLSQEPLAMTPGRMHPQNGPFTSGVLAPFLQSAFTLVVTGLQGALAPPTVHGGVYCEFELHV